MENSFEEFKKRIDEEGDTILVTALNNIAKGVCNIMRTLDNEEKKTGLRQIDNKRIKRIFSVAYDTEDYEICQAVKELLEERDAFI